MRPIDISDVQHQIESFAHKDIFIHLETTHGAYATHRDSNFFSAGAYIRNAQVNFEEGKITGNGPYRIGLRLKNGWIYAEGITHYEIDEQQRLLLAGHNQEGKLAVALQISNQAFS